MANKGESGQPLEQHHDEIQVERTTPQGTQEHGVLNGHENRDVDLGNLGKWFGGLAVGTALTFVAMWLMFSVMANIAASRDLLPSPLFNTHVMPPKNQPRLFPNPDQKPGDPHLPWEVGQAERLAENKQMEAAGLAKLDQPTQGVTMTVPSNDMSYIAAEQPKAGAASSGEATAGATLDQMPSEASGGTLLEGRQK
ncbi:MAG: hypothetical protein JO316_09295 [Abitibacteriaceae bacterium]|nr:hypothetical protein [Abditibacteriaceae bacterium]